MSARPFNRRSRRARRKEVVSEALKITAHRALSFLVIVRTALGNSISPPSRLLRPSAKTLFQ